MSYQGRLRMTKIDIVTINCGKLFLWENVDNIIENLVHVDQIQDVDIFVLGCQELTSVENGSFSGIVNEYITILQKSVLKQLGSGWQACAANHLGSITNLVFTDSKYKIENVQLLNIPRGFLGSSLKGSSIVSLQLDHKDFDSADITNDDNNRWEQFIFVCNHLTAKDGDKFLKYRQSDLVEIISKLKKQIYNWDDCHVFLYGDLNFRVNYNIKNVGFNELVNDELTYLLQNESIFEDFDEFKINFKPTYKYKLYQEDTYNNKRISSWCDRIIYKNYSKNSRNESKNNIKTNGTQSLNLIKYDSLSREKFLWTDHQPVELIIEVPTLFTNENPIVKQELYQNEKIDLIIGYACWLISSKVYVIIIIMILFLIWVWSTSY